MTTLGANNIIAIGQKFGSFHEFDVFLQNYQKAHMQNFTIKTSEKLSDNTTNKALIYKKIHFTCKFGGPSRSEATGLRKTSTFKVGCLAFIKVSLSKDHCYLEVKQAELSHINHPASQAFFHVIPENRKLSPRTQQEAKTLLELGCNKKLLQNKLIATKYKHVLLKDLSNLKATLKEEDDNDLLKAVKLLQADYGATVKVLEEQGRFKGLFFVTPDMKNAMTAWPEIVFIDGTYKLLKMGFTVMLLIVQDSNALSAVVGVGLLASEDRTTFNWFLESFKSINNEACSRMQCVMGDKDLLERDVLKEVFPGVPVYICRFHTLRTFSRVISTEKMNISKAEKATSLEILQKLVYSSSEAVYDRLYTNFCESVPNCVREYFDKNWHPIKGDWTTYSMVHGNLNNLTNNRLESMNAKIKQVVQKNSSLVTFIRHFFIWMHSHNHEVDAKTANAFLKMPVETSKQGIAEQKYRDLLMPPSFAIVSKQIKQSRYITNIVCTDRSKRKCLIRQNDTELNVTTLSCECPVWTSTFVPCRHIFGVRRYFELPLFAEELCQPRCTKEYVVQNQRAFKPNQSSTILEPNQSSPMISRVAPRKPITVPQKRKLIIPIANELVQLASTACGSRFDGRKELLQQICDSWRHGSEIQSTPDGVIQDERMNELAACDKTEKSKPAYGRNSQSTSNLGELLNAQCIIDDTSREEICDASIAEDNVLSSIKMPPPIKTIGRPSGNFATTCRIPRRRNVTRTFLEKNREDKVRDMLSWLLKEPMIDIVIQGEYQVSNGDFNIEALRDSLVDENVDIDILASYFQPMTFSTLKAALKQKREANALTCGLCTEGVEENSVICDRCLLWYHYQCVGLKRAPRAATWFCPRCNK